MINKIKIYLIMVRFILLFTLTIAIISCSENSTNPENLSAADYFDKAIIDNYSIQKVNYEDLPYNMMPLADLNNTPHPKDADGIQVFEYKGEKYYHPTLLTMQMSWYVDSFIQSGDSIYFKTILNYYDKILELIEETDNTIWIAYPFDYAIHGNIDDVMKAPWYSGMAQGTLLKIFSQLYVLTNDIKYFNQATKVFNTFNSIKGLNKRWITQIDKRNYLWIEEYPDDIVPNNTLNGFLYGLFGIYEYYLISENDHAEFLLKAGITTLKKYLTEFRAEGDLSYYCLKHKQQSRYYHILHIKQIRAIFAYTGDQFFSDMADLFYYDHQ